MIVPLYIISSICSDRLKILSTVQCCVGAQRSISPQQRYVKAVRFLNCWRNDSVCPRKQLSSIYYPIQSASVAIAAPCYAVHRNCCGCHRSAGSCGSDLGTVLSVDVVYFDELGPREHGVGMHLTHCLSSLTVYAKLLGFTSDIFISAFALCDLMFCVSYTLSAILLVVTVSVIFGHISPCAINTFLTGNGVTVKEQSTFADPLRQKHTVYTSTKQTPYQHSGFRSVYEVKYKVSSAIVVNGVALGIAVPQHVQLRCCYIHVSVRLYHRHHNTMTPASDKRAGHFCQLSDIFLADCQPAESDTCVFCYFSHALCRWQAISSQVPKTAHTQRQ